MRKRRWTARWRLVAFAVLLAAIAGSPVPAGAAEEDWSTGMTWAKVKAFSPGFEEYYVGMVMAGIAVAVRQTGSTWPEEIARTFHYCSAERPEVLREIAKGRGPAQDQTLARDLVFNAFVAACAEEKKAKGENKQ